MLTKILTTQPKKMKGFTLVELMIGVTISGFLLLGVVGTYSSIHGTVLASKELENSQEVIRYSAHVFTRSIKQSPQPVTIFDGGPGPGSTMIVNLPVSSTSCLGTEPVADFSERYDFDAPRLTCTLTIAGVASPAVTLLTGVDNMQFIGIGNMVRVKVRPLLLAQNQNFTNGDIDIDIALTTRIMMTYL